MIYLRGLSKEELLKKVAILLSSIKSDKDTKFALKADWNEDGMKIEIGLE